LFGNSRHILLFHTPRRKPAAGTKRKYDFAEARVVPVNGQAVPILRSNVHVGKAVVHGIGSVLDPNAAPAVTTEKAAAAGTAAAAAAGTAAKKTGSRKLQQFGWGMSAGPTAEQDDIAGQIQAAVNGDESVAQVADQSRLRKYTYARFCVLQITKCSERLNHKWELVRFMCDSQCQFVLGGKAGLLVHGACQ
jgi:hypothetical protein